MKKLLYIGHSYHYKTKSTAFLRDLLREEYEVEEFGYDPYLNTSSAYYKLNKKEFDIVVCFQIMPSLNELKKYVKFKTNIFFPMYDGAPSRSDHIWDEYKDSLIINFSKKLHDELYALGFNSKYIQYFPKPMDNISFGDEKSVFFWNRIEQININTVHNILRESNINHVHIHRDLDPGHNIIELNKPWDVCFSESSWFDDKKDLINKIMESSLYIAPRVFEGIGMSFLEAMAMGRCVIAPDCPTMNEYIVSGENGYLYDLSTSYPIVINDIQSIQKNTISFIKKGYEKWNNEKYNIIKWIKQKNDIDYGLNLPKITIITCTYNLIKNLRVNPFYKMVDSINKQNYRGEIEHLIIDGASKDGTIEMLHNVKGKFKVFSSPDNGIYDAMNKGISHATGEFITFLNSDDFYCRDDAISSSVHKLLLENADVSYADAYIIDKKTEKIKSYWKGSLNLIPFGQYPCHQTIVARLSAVKEAGCFNSKLICIADNNLTCAMLGLNKKFVYINKIIIKFRDEGLSNDPSYTNKINLEKAIHGSEVFYKYFSNSMTLQECNTLFNFHFLSKNKNDVFYLGEKLIFKEWKFEFYKALFSTNSYLVKDINSLYIDYNNDYFYCIRIKDFIFYYISYFTNKNSFILKKECFLEKGGISTLLHNYIKYKRYQIASVFLFGEVKIKYKSKYKLIKNKKIYIK